MPIMVSNPMVIDAVEPRADGRDTAATVHPLPAREIRAEAAWIAVVDSRPCRREFIGNFLAARHRGEARIVSLAIENLLNERPIPFGDPSMIVYSVGGLSLAEPTIGTDFERLLRRFTEVPVVVLSDVDARDEAQLAIVAGAHGFVPTMLDPQLLCAALALVQAGGKFAPPEQIDEWAHASLPHCADASDEPVLEPVPQYEELSPRQTHVLLLLQEGLANKVIAAKLGMTESTVKVHVRQIMRRLGANNRTEAALLAQRHQEALRKRAG
jgi:DNA-binding NarL/FixJ family response regulator